MFGLFAKKAQFCDLGVGADWHCHLLPGVDDGVQELEDSIRILGMMREAGIRKVVLTPHFNDEIFPANTEESIREAFRSFMEQVPGDILDGLDISLGGEYMVTDLFAQRDMKQLLQIEPGKVLIEMSYMYPSRMIKEAIFNIRMADLVPVIAHPERYTYYADSLQRFELFHDMEAQFQLNLLSLPGTYGPPSVKIMKYLLRNGWYSYLGSDTHSVPHFQNISSMRFRSDYLPLLPSGWCPQQAYRAY